MKDAIEHEELVVYVRLWFYNVSFNLSSDYSSTARSKSFINMREVRVVLDSYIP